MKRSVAFITAAVLGLAAYTTAHGYSATADVTFTWVASGTQIGWTSSSVNAFPAPTSNLEVLTAGGNNSTTYLNVDFAQSSDYNAGNGDDCLTPLPEYETITLRKYACRHNDADGYYDTAYRPVPVTDSGPGAAASGVLTVTDSTLTGTLTVISTTDEPTGGTTTVVSGVNIGANARNGSNGYNVRTADGSPFGNAWYGITTSATLAVNLTGTFSASSWAIDGGSVTFSDPNFACQQGGFGGDARGTLCSTSNTGGGFQPNGANLSWGIDPDGAQTGSTVAVPIQVKDTTGATVLATFGGVLANLSIDGAGAITTDQGEYRAGSGSNPVCPDHVRWGGDTDGGAGTTIGISCGAVNTGPLDITGVATPGFEADSFIDQIGVALSTPVVSNAVSIVGQGTGAAISVTGGEYSVNGGAYTGANGTVDDGSTVTVRHTSAATEGTDTDTVLTVGSVSDTFTSTTLAVDTDPVQFTFVDVPSAPLSTQQISNSVAISDIDAAAPISVTGGEYAINGGAYTAVAGTVADGDDVTVRHTSSASFSTNVDTVLTIGTISDTFRSTTVAEDADPVQFTFVDVPSAPLSTQQTSNSVDISGINTAAPISVIGGEYAINGGAYTAVAGTVAVGDDVTVRHTSSASFATNVDTVLTIGTISDTFRSTTLAADTIPNAFSFTDVTDAELDTEQVSNIITVGGINTTTPISVTGGGYAINGGAYTPVAGTVVNGDTVTVLHISSSDEDTDTDTVLTIGGIADTFTSTTLTTAAPPNGLREDDGGSSLDALILALLGISALIRRRR